MLSFLSFTYPQKKTTQYVSQFSFGLYFQLTYAVISEQMNSPGIIEVTLRVNH